MIVPCVWIMASCAKSHILLCQEETCVGSNYQLCKLQYPSSNLVLPIIIYINQKQFVRLTIQFRCSYLYNILIFLLIILWNVKNAHDSCIWTQTNVYLCVNSSWFVNILYWIWSYCAQANLILLKSCCTWGQLIWWEQRNYHACDRWPFNSCVMRKIEKVGLYRN